jgi:uncharacterized lipoprotein YajG
MINRGNMEKNIVSILLTVLILTSCTASSDVKLDEVPPKYVITTIIEERGFSEQIKLP